MRNFTTIYYDCPQHSFTIKTIQKLFVKNV